MLKTRLWNRSLKIYRYKKQGDNIVFKRVHVSRDDSVAPQQRLFFTLQAMGLLDKLHAKVFNAMHVERNRLATDDAVFDFVAKQGVDRQKFIDTYHDGDLHCFPLSSDHLSMVCNRAA